jgi:Flp pilus assembly protein CpaB
MAAQNQESVVNSRRTVILIIAVVVGAVAAVGLLGYVRNAETTAGEAAAPVEIWVVKEEVPKGTPIEAALEQQLIAKEETAQKYRPATAAIDPATELAGLVAITDLPIDMPVLTGSFVSPKVVNTGITDRLEERGLVTVTFTVDQARGAAYLIEPGDFVNVMVERDWDTPFFEDDPPLDVTPRALAELSANLEINDAIRPLMTDLYPVESRVVYQKAEVLAVGSDLVPDIGQTVAEDAEAVANQGLITLAVPPEAVQVILNVGRDNIYLSLVPDDYEPRPLLPLDPTTQVLPGEADGRLTPYAGYDGVTDPGAAAAELTFTDEEGRIGSTPSAGGSSESTEPETTGGSSGSGEGRTSTTVAPEPTDGSETQTDGEATTTSVTQVEGQ